RKTVAGERLVGRQLKEGAEGPDAEPGVGREGPERQERVQRGTHDDSLGEDPAHLGHRLPYTGLAEPWRASSRLPGAWSGEGDQLAHGQVEEVSIDPEGVS